MRHRLSLLLALISALAATAVAPTVASAAAPAAEFHYVPVSGDEEIAVKVMYPSDYVAGQKYPVVFTMDGYGGAGSSGSTSPYPGFVFVYASVRGTGCSSGQLELFSRRSAEDGKEIIDDWLPTQDWFDGEVGITGHSYSGLTGFLVAATTPDNVKAIAVSGLIDDFYRGILYPGGVPNPGFPVLWGAGLRPFAEHISHTEELQNDQHCRENYADHQGTNALNVQGLLDTYPNREATPDSWAIRAGLMSHIDGIQAPIQIGQQYQDEQTGPRGGHVLWEHVDKDVPKRIVLSTGMHNPNDPHNTKKDWLDCWILRDGDTEAFALSGRPCSDVLDEEKRVLAYFESMGSDRLDPYVTGEWPFRETDWERYYLHSDMTLSDEAEGGDGEVQYLSTSTGRHLTGDIGGYGPDGWGALTYTTGLPDTARYELDFSEDTAIAGPSTLTLHASGTSADVDFFVEVLDVAPDGSTTFVQRGLQRGSFRGAIPEQSATVQTGEDHKGEIYRPYHDFQGTEPMIPGEIYRFDIEVFPFGHIFREGHKMVLQIHAPPLNDPISTYLYEPNQPSVVTIYQDAEHRSSILLPFMRSLPPMRATTPGCGDIVGEVCVTPELG